MRENTNGSYPALKAEIVQFLYSQSVDGRIRAMVIDLVNQALRTKRILLSNPEKEMLSTEVLEDVLRAMLAEMET